MKKRSETTITLVGTGAMACLLAARLSPHASIIMLGNWVEGLEALSQKGVRLLDTDGTEKTIPVRATNDPADCAGTQYAIVLVKSWQTSRAASVLKACLAADGLALSLQNGLGNLEHLQQVLGEQRATLGVTTQGATLLGPGYVRASGGGPTHVGLDPRLESLIDLLRKAGLDVEREQDLEGMLWGKLAINAGINPLTALLQVPNGELLERPQAKSLMVAAAEETAAVASGTGVELPYQDPGHEVCEVASRTASNYSSMLQDVMRRAPTEIDAISGAVARRGELVGVPAPINNTLWSLVRALVSPYAGGTG